MVLKQILKKSALTLLQIVIILSVVCVLSASGYTIMFCTLNCSSLFALLWIPLVYGSPTLLLGGIHFKNLLKTKGGWL